MTTRTVARPSEMVTLYPLDGGPSIQRWPVDARDVLACGGWSLTDPKAGDVVTDLPVAPAPDLGTAVPQVSRAGDPGVGVPVPMSLPTERKPAPRRNRE